MVGNHVIQISYAPHCGSIGSLVLTLAFCLFYSPSSAFGVKSLLVSTLKEKKKIILK
jgi:hypothetical protein